MKHSNQRWCLLWTVGTILLCGLSGCDAVRPPASLSHEDLDAALWMRTSAEYQVFARVAYQQASLALTKALQDPLWSALPEQASRLLANSADTHSTLPPAVIVDVDETILDNTNYQVRQIEQGTQHDPAEWDAWVSKSEATLVPGADEFLKSCRDLGITVFFITNRGVEQERFTRRNLEGFGLIDPQAVDNILSKNERDTWTVDKTSRRDYVASRYRVLVVIGDDLNDFLWPGEKASPVERTEAALKLREYWGQKWFLLPNANYGGWERAVYQYDDELSRDKKLKIKLQSLRTGPTN
ncbi:MAG TPA: HAD family acid phosphatase [Pirellulaceae bacterium]